MAKAHELTALAAVEAIKTHEMTVSDYIAGLISHLEVREPELQAFEYFEPALAKEQARKLDAKANLGSLPLAGLAVGIKDIIDTKDMPTENGTPLDAGRRPAADADVVRLLREAGAVIMGKTVTTELAFMQPAKTCNPHNKAHTPGGSSSGSAAAVASGMVPVALGTQTNGSVIRPAAFCGIFGLKPTHGLISTKGILEEARTFDTVGVFARSLADAALVSEVLVKNGMRKRASNYLKAAQDRSFTPRFAFIRTPAWPHAEGATKEKFEKLARSLGPACEELQLPPEFDRAVAFHRTIMLAEIALNFGHYYERGKERLSRVMRDAIESGRAISAVDYADALRARDQLYEQFVELLKPYDAAITPSAAGPAPRGFETTGNPVFCTLWTYLGVPALNLPLLAAAGLPLGVQLVADRFAEERLFMAGAHLASKSALEAAKQKVKNKKKDSTSY